MTLPDLPYDLEYAIIIPIIVVWIITLIFIKYFGNFIKKMDELSESFDISHRTYKTIDRILDTLAVFLAVGISLNILGLSGVLYASLGAIGVMGLIIGMAVKDITANIFAGFMMVFNPSFLVGEYIEVDKYGGTVEKISLRMTMLKRSDGVIMVLPNTLLTTKPVINYSAAINRRIEITVAIANETDVEKALKLLRKAAEEHNKTVPSEDVNVVLIDVKDYAVDLTLRFWVPKSSLRSSTSEVLKKIHESFKENNIELAVPLRKYV